MRNRKPTPRLVAATAGTLALIGTWILAAESRGPLPAGDFAPHVWADWMLRGPDADAVRRDAIRRAAVRIRDGNTGPVMSDAPRHPASHPVSSDPASCRFLRAAPSGTSAKFDCVLDGGEVVKIKYGRNPEIQAEAAATRLLIRLGFGADHVEIVPRLRCHGCPRFPFFTLQLLSAGFGVIGERGYEGGYTDFEWVALERRFPAPAIETIARRGWAWWELDGSAAPAAEIDALRLLAVFLAHWDNKAENQRLVCLDDAKAEAGGHRTKCDRPLLMIQDLGATFGPNKVNLARWREFPIWHDRAACLVSLRRLPFGAGTFHDVAISEGGRVRLGRQLAALSDAEVLALFEAARFQDYHAGTDDRRDLIAWQQAFRDRVDQILSGGPCPS